MERYIMWRLAAWKGSVCGGRRHGKVQYVEVGGRKCSVCGGRRHGNLEYVEASGMEKYSMWRLATWKGT